MIASPSHTIVFGAITMVEQGANPPDESGVQYIVRAQDTDLGNPAPVTVALLSLMRAGSLVAYDHTENRQPVLRVTIKADDSDLLARGERALQLECERPNTLTWIPPDGAGEASVFDVVWSQMDLVLDDLQELRRQRTYLIRLQALPHARPAELVVTPAQTLTPTFDLVDNGSALTGAGFAWTAESGSSVAIDTARIKLSRPSGLAGALRTGALDISAAKYLVIDASWTVSPTAIHFTALDAVGNLVAGPLVASQDQGGGVTRMFFQTPTGVSTLSQLKIRVSAAWAPGLFFYIDQIQTADAIPFFGTARQKAMSLVPGGSAKAEGSIHVSHDTDALGQVIVYTHESGTGYLPPLRSWRVSSQSVTADATLLSGSRNALGPTGTTYRVPVRNLPEGRAEIWAWLRATTLTGVKEIGWSLSSWMNGTALSYEVQLAALDFPALDNWYLLPIGAVTLPPVQIGPAGYIEVALQENPVTHGIQVDESYLFATETGQLTLVYCGAGAPSAGGPSTQLWIDAPSPEQRTGGIYRGNAEDRSDAWHAGNFSEAWGLHDLDPRGASIFVATQTALDAETSLEHYPRFHTHVATDL